MLTSVGRSLGLMGSAACALCVAAACSASNAAQEPNGQGGTDSGGNAGEGGTAGSGGSTTTGTGGGLGFGGSGGGALGIYSDVEVVITADNAYGFGYGTETSMLNYFGGVEASLAGEIFNCNGGPETYTVPADAAGVGNYLYVIGYADKATTQGVLGQFYRVGGGDPVYTGHGDWEVCATGQDFNPGSGGPTLADINAALPGCSWFDEVGAANGKVQYGEDNTTPRTTVTAGNEFPITCNIDDDAKWMWFNWDPQNIVWPTNGSPFIWPGGSGNPAGEFLIFRLKATDVPPIPR